jgi:hypothetical protein
MLCGRMDLLSTIELRNKSHISKEKMRIFYVDMVRRGIRLVAVVSMLALGSPAWAEEAASQIEKVNMSPAFEQLKGLLGRWKGELIKEGEGGKVVQVESEFRLVSNDSVIVERTSEDGVEMVTIYHERQGRLSVTHYCALGNAPVFELVESKDGLFRFAFDPICGLKVGRDEFVQSWVIELDDEEPDQFKTYYEVSETAGITKVSSGRLKRVE